MKSAVSLVISEGFPCLGGYKPSRLLDEPTLDQFALRKVMESWRMDVVCNGNSQNFKQKNGSPAINSVKFPREQSNQCELLATEIASLARRMECLGGGG